MFAPGYIQPQDQGRLGIPDATPAQIAAASRLVDAQIARPHGLLWSPDANGQPAYMTTKTPTRSGKTADDIAPGASVVVSLTYGSFGRGDIGSAVVLDRKNISETCIIVAASGNTITLDAVQFAHPAGSTVEFGLTVDEESAVTYGALIQVAARPVVRILGITGSYRSDGRGYISIADNLMNIGRDGDLWNSFPLDQCDIDDIQGTCWMLPGEVRGGFSRVRVSYIAGWSYDSLPFAIQQATANIVRNAIDTQVEMPGNITMAKAGNAAFERKTATHLDADTIALLAPYRNIRL